MQRKCYLSFKLKKMEKKNNIDDIHAFYEIIAILATMDLME